jgi:hypothetical protein
MEFRRLSKAFGSLLRGLLRSRGMQARLFSGTPVVSRIDAISGPTPGFSLLFRNGLMLTLGEAGILDYQDRGFGNFIGGTGLSVAPDNREFLVQLHKLVLKSLLRYITHPGLDTVQREFAAEAATKLWLVEENRPDDKIADTGRQRVHSASDFPVSPDSPQALGGGSWSMGSSRESAPFR